MGQLDLDYKPAMDYFLTLSTGTVVDMRAENFGEAIEAVENLVTTIVMEHIEEIFKTYDQTGRDLTPDLIEAEVEYLVENEFSDNPKGALKFFLMIFSLQRHLCITDEVRKMKKGKGQLASTK